MRAVADDDLITPPTMRQDGDGVAHCAAWHIERGVFAHARGGQFFQPIHGGVFTIHIVADLRAIYRLTHGRRRFSHSIATQIDQSVFSGALAGEDADLRLIALMTGWVAHKIGTFSMLLSLNFRGWLLWPDGRTSCAQRPSPEGAGGEVKARLPRPRRR